MQAFENRFMRLLAERINASIEARLQQLADPKSKAKDFAEYLGRVEGMQVLRNVIAMMEDINRELGGPESDVFPNRAVRQSPDERTRPSTRPPYGV